MYCYNATLDVKKRVILHDCIHLQWSKTNFRNESFRLFKSCICNSDEMFLGTALNITLSLVPLNAA